MAKEKKNIEPVTVATDKKKALEIALAQMEKQFGKTPSCAWDRRAR